MVSTLFGMFSPIVSKRPIMPVDACLRASSRGIAGKKGWMPGAMYGSMCIPGLHSFPQMDALHTGNACLEG